MKESLTMRIPRLCKLEKYFVLFFSNVWLKLLLKLPIGIHKWVEGKEMNPDRTVNSVNHGNLHIVFLIPGVLSFISLAIAAPLVLLCVTDGSHTACVLSHYPRTLLPVPLPESRLIGVSISEVLNRTWFSLSLSPSRVFRVSKKWRGRRVKVDNKVRK